MLARCYNPNNESYHNYGGRGITVCDRWKNSFKNFYEDMGDALKGHSLDRIDNDGNYELSNCKWSTYTEQMNNKQTNRLLTYNGITLTMAEWSRKLNIDQDVIYMRLKRGMTVERALTQNVRKINNTYLFNGKRKTLKKWAEIYGVSYMHLYNKIYKGQSINQILTNINN